MRRIAIAVVGAVACAIASPASAWWDEGHMQIAYLAYKRLDPAVIDKVDALLRMNPDYASWTADAPDAKTERTYAFVHAATWADDIKTKRYGYRRDVATEPTAGRNIGYADHDQHAYWHFKDVEFSPDGTTPTPSSPVDLVSQLKLMIAAMPPSSGASDDVRSYDLVWTIHLVGDAHQPLHAISRFTHEIPKGDAGGNAESVVPATGETLPLHAYWDRVFGGYSTPYGAVADADAKDGLASVAVDPSAAQVLDPEVWVQESADLAKRFAYAPPIGPGKDPAMLTRDYETETRNTARLRAGLAAARLANLLNSALR